MEGAVGDVDVGAVGFLADAVIAVGDGPADEGDVVRVDGVAAVGVAC